MSSLLPHSWQHYLGESNSRLGRWEMNRAGLALATMRAIRLPPASRASDSILRKSTSAPTAWQRMLNLTWVQRSQNERRSPSQTAHVNADWQRTNDTGLRSKDLHVARQVPTPPVADEAHLVDERIEAYPLTTREPLPLTSDLLSPPVTRKELLSTTRELPFVTNATTMPLTTKQMVERRYLSQPAGTVHVAKEERPVSV